MSIRSAILEAQEDIAILASIAVFGALALLVCATLLVPDMSHPSWGEEGANKKKRPPKRRAAQKSRGRKPKTRSRE